MAIAAPAGDAHILFGDWQRRVVLMLLFSGLGFGAVGALVAPRDATYWLAVAAVPVLAAVLGFVLGGASGRALEARLIGGDTAREAPRLVAPAALPAPVRDALQTAVLPVLLAELAGAADRMAPRQRTAALALVEAGATAPESEARQALARDLPRLIAALAAGGATATDETDALTRRLAQPTPRPGGAP
jgi:hypothetical protein